MATRKKKPPQPDLWELWNGRLRGLGLWLFGVYGTWNELFIRSEIRVPALAIFGTFLGLPIANWLDTVLAARKAQEGK